MVPRCHDGDDGSECTARWVFRVLRATVWGTYCTMHAPAAQYLPRTVSHHSTQASFYLLFTTVLGRGQHFSPSGLAGNGNDKDRAREAGARRSAAGAGTLYLLCRWMRYSVLSPEEVSAHSAVAEYSTRRPGLLAYELGKPAKYITPTHARTQAPSHSPIPLFVMTISLLRSQQSLWSHSTSTTLQELCSHLQDLK